MLPEHLPVLPSSSLHLPQALISQKAQFLTFCFPLIRLLGEHVGESEVLIRHEFRTQLRNLLLILETGVLGGAAPLGEVTDFKEFFFFLC